MCVCVRFSQNFSDYCLSSFISNDSIVKRFLVRYPYFFLNLMKCSLCVIRFFKTFIIDFAQSEKPKSWFPNCAQWSFCFCGGAWEITKGKTNGPACLPGLLQPTLVCLISVGGGLLYNWISVKSQGVGKKKFESYHIRELVLLYTGKQITSFWRMLLDFFFHISKRWNIWLLSWLLQSCEYCLDWNAWDFLKKTK